MTTDSQAIRPVVSSLHAGRIDADAVAAFALATNDPNPRYLTGRAVPPLYTACLVAAAQNEAQELSGSLSAVTGWGATVHGEHEVYCYAPLRPEMELRWSAVTHRARQKSTGVVVVEKITLTDPQGCPLVEHYWSNFFIGGRIEADFGPDSPSPPTPGQARRMLAGSRTVAVKRDQAYRYAGVSGDHAGHAMDDAIARSEGYPGKILQGMCTFSLVSAALVDLLAGGDPERIHRMAVRFSAPAYPSRELEVTAHEVGPPAGAGRLFAFEAEQSGVKVLTSGQVELFPA